MNKKLKEYLELFCEINILKFFIVGFLVWLAVAIILIVFFL